MKICKKCKGKGWYYHRDFPLWWLAPFTLGISLFLAEKHKCRVCESKGYYKND